MKINGVVEIIVDDKEIAKYLWNKITALTGTKKHPSDEWYTDETGSVYIGSKECNVSDNEIVGRLVDTANYLTNEALLKIDSKTGRTYMWSKSII